MRCTAATAIILGSMLAAGEARAQNLPNPYTFSCGDYVGAGAPEARARANFVLYWALGYLQARLAPLPTTNFSADTFAKDIQDVHSALLRICPNVPGMSIPEFMSNLAADFKKSAQQQ